MDSYAKRKHFIKFSFVPRWFEPFSLSLHCLDINCLHLSSTAPLSIWAACPSPGHSNKMNTHHFTRAALRKEGLVPQEAPSPKYGRRHPHKRIQTSLINATAHLNHVIIFSSSYLGVRWGGCTEPGQVLSFSTHTTPHHSLIL